MKTVQVTRGMGQIVGEGVRRGYRLVRVTGKALRNRVRSAVVPPAIFVIGTGRSGTHWVGSILDAHPDVTVTVENPPIFGWVTRAAVDPTQESGLVRRLSNRYRLEMLAAAPNVYADKSHPNIWLAERLAREFPTARFLGVHREVFGTVASMLKHSNVRHWHETWREHPIPNRFLGITVERAKTYASLSLAAQCAIRWQAHTVELARLEDVIGSRLHIVSYEALQTKTEEEVDRLGRFLSVSRPIPIPEIRAESLDRWRSELAPETQQQIRAVLDDRREHL